MSGVNGLKIWGFPVLKMSVIGNYNPQNPLFSIMCLYSHKLQA